MRLQRVDLSGWRCVVTGPTSGHGEAVAHALARWGAQLVLVARNRDKAHAVAEALRTASPTGRTPEVVLADLSLRREVRQAAETIAGAAAAPRPVHLLVNNAGIVSHRRRETEDGIEAVLATNFLAPFELTLRLLPALRAAGTPEAPARVVNVASDMHRLYRLRLEDLQLRKGYSWHRSYGQSKLALLYSTRELGRRLGPPAPKGESRVTVNAVDPGPVRSGIASSAPAIFARPTEWMMRAFFPPAPRAARTALWVATDPTLARHTGAYFRFGRQRVPATPDEARVTPALIAESLRLTGLDPSALP